MPENAASVAEQVREKMLQAKRLREEVEVLDNEIETLLAPEVDRLIAAADFDGAKRYVRQSFRQNDYESPDLVLFFRKIIMSENAAKAPDSGAERQGETDVL